MKIVIIGGGKVGIHLTHHLSQEGHACVIVDNDSSVVNEIVNTFNVLGVVGNGANIQIQKEAGCDKADLVIAVTDLDEVNLLCSVIAQKLGAKYTVVRARNSEYAEQILLLQEKLGFSLAINPDLETAKEIASMLNVPASVQSESFWRGKATLVEIEVTTDSIFNNLHISEVSKLGSKFLVCAVERGKDVVIPRGDFEFKIGDKIHLIGSLAELVKLFKKMGIYQDKAHNVMVAGGSRIAEYLSQILPDLNVGVKIIESDKKKCNFLAERYPRVSVVFGDASDEDLLKAEGLARMNAFVALTNFDETNLVLSLSAQHQNVAKVICKLNKNSFADLYKDIHGGNTVSPKEITANHILRYVRAMSNSFDQDSVKTLFRIVNNTIDAVEFDITHKSAIKDMQIKDIKCKNETLIACIERNGKVIIPSGQDYVYAGDSIIVISKERLNDVDDIRA